MLVLDDGDVVTRMTGRDPMEYGWWLASRASGLVALALITLSVTLGLAMAGRVSREPKLRRAMLAVHEHAALAAPDRDRRPRHHAARRQAGCTRARLGILVPFHMDHEPLFTGLGIIAGYLAAALGLSFYARRRIGTKRWRSLHRRRSSSTCWPSRTRSAPAATPARRGCARSSC